MWAEAKSEMEHFVLPLTYWKLQYDRCGSVHYTYHFLLLYNSLAQMEMTRSISSLGPLSITVLILPSS